MIGNLAQRWPDDAAQSIGRRAALAGVILCAAVFILPAVATAETSHTLSFVQRTYDDARDQTSFTYRLETGDSQTVDRVILGFGLCNRPTIVAASPQPGGVVQGLNRPIADRATGIYGVGWDGQFTKSTHLFSYALDGDVPLGVVHVALRSGGRSTPKLAPGPDCLATSRGLQSPQQPIRVKPPVEHERLRIAHTQPER